MFWLWGGGDTSSEYCQVLVEEGNQVTLAYRGDKFHRMMDQNVQAIEKLAIQNKMKIQLSCNIKEVKDAAGKPEVIFEDQSTFPTLIYDKVIYSIGGTTPVNFLKSIGIEFEKDWPKFLTTCETNVKNVYLLGDLVIGKSGGSIITAYNASFKAAADIVHKLGISQPTQKSIS